MPPQLLPILLFSLIAFKIYCLKTNFTTIRLWRPFSCSLYPKTNPSLSGSSWHTLVVSQPSVDTFYPSCWSIIFSKASVFSSLSVPIPYAMKGLITHVGWMNTWIASQWLHFAKLYPSLSDTTSLHLIPLPPHTESLWHLHFHHLHHQPVVWTRAQEMWQWSSSFSLESERLWRANFVFWLSQGETN